MSGGPPISPAPAIAAAAPMAYTLFFAVKPSDYLMSEFIESHPGSGDWHVVSRGKPKHDWSGIDTTEPKPAYVPTQI